MKNILIIFSLNLLLSCATTEPNISRDVVNITIFERENNENITIELNVIEITLITYEDNWSYPRVSIRIEQNDILNMENNIILLSSVIKINERLISNIWDGASGQSLSDNGIKTFEISYRITDEIIDYIRTLRTIKIKEEFRENTRNITNFENNGSLNNLFKINNNYISTLYKFMNTKLTDIIIFSGDNRLEYEFDNENQVITRLHINLTRYSYLSLSFEKNPLGNSYPTMVFYVFDGNRFNSLLPPLLAEIGDPNGEPRNFANNNVAWWFKEMNVTLFLGDNFTAISISKGGK